MQASCIYALGVGGQLIFQEGEDRVPHHEATRYEGREEAKAPERTGIDPFVASIGWRTRASHWGIVQINIQTVKKLLLMSLKGET